MRKIYVPFLICLLLSEILQAQKKVIAVIGSSSAYGFGATPIDSSWVNLTKRYFKSQGLIDTIFNLGNPSATSYAGMPDNSIPPQNRPVPDPIHNISKALRYNPDVVIINYPSNDIGDGFTLTEYLFNLRTLYNAVIAAKKICYVTTTQPRNFFSPAEKQNLKIGRDSILKEFGAFALDFYDPVVDTVSLNIKAIYNYDGTHVNNKGHQLFFQVVKGKNILAVGPPAFSLTSFNVGLQTNTVLIKWSGINDLTSTLYEVQRSTDSLTFQTIHQENGNGGTTGADYAWRDSHPLSGKSFYRLKITNTNTVSYSGIISLVYIVAPPFSLTSFNAGLQGNAALIYWATLNDLSATLFEVQRSSDTLNFQTIHQENGKGGSPSATYSWTDANPLIGKSFYRLKITLNGALSYSLIVSLINESLTTFSLTSFTADQENNNIKVGWTTLNEQLSTSFEVQRGPDSLQLETIHQENGKGISPSSDYSWTDTKPLVGKSFYRLKISVSGKISYTAAISMYTLQKSFAIDRMYFPGKNSNLVLKLRVVKNQLLMITIINSSGVNIRKQSYDVWAPATDLSVNISGLAYGVYYIRITAFDGDQEVRSFLNF